MAQNNANQKLNDLLISKNFDPQSLNNQGKPAASPEEADLFSFDYKGESGQDYGTVVIMLNDENDLNVYFGDNIGKSMEGDDKKGWFDFLYQLRMFAKRNLFSFTLQNLNKLKYSMQGQAAISEGLFESWQGKKDLSWNADSTQARLLIKHKRNIGEGEARFRNIQSLFIETADGERFKLPFTKLSAGRAMLEHVRQGGKPYDVRGNHIVTIVEEMNLLSRFRRANQGKIFEGETQQLVEQATHYFETLQSNLKSLSTKVGYTKYFESWNPAALTDEDVIIEDLRHMFIEQNIDSRIEQALPLLARLQQEHNMKEANIFENWTNLILEGTWAIPDTKEKQTALVTLLSQELPVGADATNATELLYDLLGDDELFDRLEELAEQDANADAREIILNRLEELKDNPDIAQVIGQLKTPEAGQEELDEYVAGVGGQREFKNGQWVPVTKQANEPVKETFNTDDASPVESAIINRIMRAHPDLLVKFGPEAIMTAARDQAEWIGDVDEIGSSDVSGWVNNVVRDLESTTQELDELSPDTLKSYVKRASSDRAMRNFDQGVDAGTSMNDREPKFDKENSRKDDQRRHGIHKALGKLEEGAMKDWLWNEAERLDRDTFISNAGEYGMTPEEAAEWWDSINGVEEGVSGALAGGALGAYATKSVRGTMLGAKLGSKAQDYFAKKNKTMAVGEYNNNPTVEYRGIFYVNRPDGSWASLKGDHIAEPAVKQVLDKMLQQKTVSEGNWLEDINKMKKSAGLSEAEGQTPNIAPGQMALIKSLRGQLAGIAGGHGVNPGLDTNQMASLRQWFTKNDPITDPAMNNKMLSALATGGSGMDTTELQSLVGFLDNIIKTYPINTTGQMPGQQQTQGTQQPTGVPNMAATQAAGSQASQAQTSPSGTQPMGQMPAKDMGAVQTANQKLGVAIPRLKEETALTGPYGHSGKLEPVEGTDEDMMARIKFLAGIRENDTATDGQEDSNLTAIKSVSSIFIR
jgi:hypothetical protein